MRSAALCALFIAMPAVAQTEQPWLEVKGRVIGHLRLARYPDVDPPEHLELAMQTARLGAQAHVTDAISATIDVELAGRPALRDAFVEHETEYTVFRMGQMKMPSLVITRASPWVLPLARRGAVNALLTDYLQVAGRRPGLMFEWRGGGGLDPSLTVGAFQGSYWVADGDGAEIEPIEDKGWRAAKPVVRLSASPSGVEIGAWAEARPFPVALRALRYLGAGGLDLTVDERFKGHALRAWVEGTVGRSWADEIWNDATLTGFAAARGLVAWRFGGASSGERYLEPYAGANLLDLDSQVGHDMVSEFVGGLNAGLWKRARVGLEFSTVAVGANAAQFQSSWVGTGNTPPARDHITVILQAGAAF